MFLVLGLREQLPEDSKDPRKKILFNYIRSLNHGFIILICFWFFVCSWHNVCGQGGIGAAREACRAGGKVRWHGGRDEGGDRDGGRAFKRREKSSFGCLQERGGCETQLVAGDILDRAKDRGLRAQTADGKGIPGKGREGATRNLLRRAGKFSFNTFFHFSQTFQPFVWKSLNSSWRQILWDFKPTFRYKIFWKVMSLSILIFVSSEGNFQFWKKKISQILVFRTLQFDYNSKESTILNMSSRSIWWIRWFYWMYLNFFRISLRLGKLIFILINFEKWMKSWEF